MRGQRANPRLDSGHIARPWWCCVRALHVGGSRAAPAPPRAACRPLSRSRPVLPCACNGRNVRVTAVSWGVTAVSWADRSSGAWPSGRWGRDVDAPGGAVEAGQAFHGDGEPTTLSVGRLAAVGDDMRRRWDAKSSAGPGRASAREQRRLAPPPASPNPSPGRSGCGRRRRAAHTTSPGDASDEAAARTRARPHRGRASRARGCRLPERRDLSVRHVG